MKSKLARFSIIGLITLIAVFLIVGLGAALKSKELGSPDVAGWVQAVGATLGIFIAVWVPYRQRQDAIASAESDRREAAFRVCLALLDELTLTTRAFSGRNVVELLRDAPGEIFNLEIPIPRERFPVYSTMIGRLTEVDNGVTRRAVIEAYGSLSGLINVAEMNNRLAREFNDLARQAHINKNETMMEEVEFKRMVLVNLREQMRNLCETAIRQTNAAVDLLDSEVRAHR